MKAAFLGAILFAASAPAQVLKPIDPRQQADINGKTVDMPTVNFSTVPQPTSPQPVSPLSHQYRERANTVETKRVDTETLSYSIIPTSIVPQQNFSAKRAVIPGQLPPAERVNTPNADINKRVIRATTPAGKDELKEQFKNPH